MRYEPYDEEHAEVPAMNNAQLFNYFLMRVYETEEVWGAKEVSTRWFTYPLKGQETLPLWAYKRYAEESAVGEWEHLIQAAESLEFFMDRTIPQLIADKVQLEIMPRKEGPGALVLPEQLHSILEGIMDSGQYSMEG